MIRKLVCFVLFITLIMVTGCSVSKSYYYDEYTGKFWGEIRKLDEPVYFGETKTKDQVLENAKKAIELYFGEETNIKEYMPFSINFFTDENTWMIITEYDPDRLGGGICFTIDGKTGELSDYELNE